MPPLSDKAVIFDVDGVLVDSYEAHLRSWMETARELGLRFSGADFHSSFGCTSREIIHRLWQVEDERRVWEIDDRKETLYRAIVSENVPVMDGATELIDALASAGFALAMGSSGPPENLEMALNALERRRAFAAVVSGKDVRRGKPDPDVFIIAASRLEVAPQSCVVIEDAPVGVRAAHAAGMRTIALLSRGRRVSDFATHAPDMFAQSLRSVTPEVVSQLLVSGE